MAHSTDHTIKTGLGYRLKMIRIGIQYRLHDKNRVRIQTTSHDMKWHKVQTTANEKYWVTIQTRGDKMK